MVEKHRTVPPYDGVFVCLHQSLSLSSSASSGVMEDGVQLGIHQPFMV